jgi:hypothetical protein
MAATRESPLPMPLPITAKNVKFREDVRHRKLTVATGSGQVHGGTFVLRNWGLADLAFS